MRHSSALTLAVAWVSTFALTLPFASLANGQQLPAAASPSDPQFAAPPSPDNSVTAEVAIVGGNAASARQRALEQAFLVAFQRAFDAVAADLGLIVEGQVPPAWLGPLRATLGAQARQLTVSYQVLSQDQEGGRFRVRVDARVNDERIRRAIDRARRENEPAAAAASSIVVAGDEPQSVGGALAQALRGAGAQVQLIDVPVADIAQARAKVPAGASVVIVLFRIKKQEMGSVRGSGHEAASCGLEADIFPPATATPSSQIAVAEYGFAFGPAGALSVCTSRATAALSARILPAIAAAGQIAGAASIMLDIALDQPAAIEILLEKLAAMGSIESSELRRIEVGSVQIRVVTAMPAQRLAQAVQQALAGTLVVGVGEVTPNVAKLKVAFPELVPEEPVPAAGAVPGAASGSVFGATGPSVATGR